jgi:dolichol kinase
MATIGGALLLRWLTWPQAALLAAGVIAFNTTLLPRLAPGILRPPARGRPDVGVLVFPVALLLLILAFRSRLHLAAMAWTVLAIGDGAATLAGRLAGGPRLPWNRSKTWAGSAGFVVAAWPAACLAGEWVAAAASDPPAQAWLIWGSLAATVAGALAETVPVRVDDNLLVPCAAALALAVADVQWN